VLYILDGTTVCEVGGTPKGAHSTGPGEWIAPESEGAVTYKLNKGDMLVIPRGTPHKRLTEGSVTLILISPMGA
jgi:mannose-6-phosphate isomerase-like protein (cupin superfamily)